MHQAILEIEYKLSELEATPTASLTEHIFTELLDLRRRAFSHWIEEDSADLENDDPMGIRDRITKIEQRLLNLSAEIPATSVSGIHQKLKLWMLFKDLPGPQWPSQDVSDDLIVSVFMDLTRADASEPATDEDSQPNLKWVC